MRRRSRSRPAQPPPPGGSVFVTVGTTQFDALVAAACDPVFASAVAECGFSRVLLQVGRGPMPGGVAPGGGEFRVRGVAYAAYALKASVAEDLAAAAVVVSHAGAGTVYEALRGGCQRLLVVVNPALADNHQAELARAMVAGGHCAAAGLGGGVIDARELADGLRAVAAATFKPLPPPNLAPFVALVDRLCGFAE